MPTSKLETLKSLLLTTLSHQDLKTGSNPWTNEEIIDRTASLHMTLGSIHRELGEYKESQHEFNHIFANEKHIQKERLVIPFTCYEQGILHFQQQDYKSMKSSFNKVKSGGYSEYHFEMRLEFRIHMAMQEIDKRGLK